MKAAAFCIGWLILLTGSRFALESYNGTPGAQSPAPIMWPAGSTLRRVPGTPTLVMMTDPHCACTNPSLVELKDVLSQYKGRLTVYVLFVQPKGLPYEWAKTDAWEYALQIGGARVLIDNDATESDRFQALTSGQVVVYDAKGQLEFSGGITSACGSARDKGTVARILSVLRGENTDRSDTPVFGCPLHGEPAPQ